MRFYQFNAQFRFSLKQYLHDFCWAFQELRSSRKDASLKRALRFCLHSLLHVNASAAWLRFLRKSHLLTTSVTEATFIDRIFRPFFDKRYSTYERMQLLCSHFEILSYLLDKEQLHAVMSGSGINLVSLTGKTGEVIQVNLTRLPNFDKEGAATIELSIDGKTIQMVTFTLECQGNKNVLKIGGIQSKEHAGTDPRTLLREATHALHGIQPRILMIETLRLFSQQLHCDLIECISEDNHVYRALRYLNKKKIHAQYNPLWLLVGGELNVNGNFSIPRFVEEKSIESRPSKKRNEYRHRAALLGSIRQQVKHIIEPMLATNPIPTVTVNVPALYPPRTSLTSRSVVVS